MSGEIGLLPYLTLSVFPAALLIAAANDLYEFKIPNWLTITMIAAYPVAGLAVGAAPSAIGEGFLIGAGALAIGFTLFAFNIIGGGDAKLLAAAAPWFGLISLGQFLFAMAICGFFLTFGLLTFRRTPVLPAYSHAQWILRLHQRKRDLPYGVAIAAGGLITFPQTPFYQLVFGA